MAVMRGAEYFTGDMFEHYTNVCNVAKQGGLFGVDEDDKGFRRIPRRSI